MNYRFVRAILSPLIRVIWPTKIWCKQNALTEQKAVFICNHYSLMDSNALVAQLFKKKFNALVKQEAFKEGFASKFLTAAGGIPIKRGEPDITAVKKIMAVLDRNEPILIYPEGTRNEKDCKSMLPFKSGPAVFAIKKQAPIIPMIFYRSAKVFRKNYVLIGKPIYLEQYYNQNVSQIKEEATQILYEAMVDLRAECDVIVEKYKGNYKKYMKNKAQGEVIADNRR
ncbi:MAG: lysophospholipid acyltransferase family protein [Clostridia bacterium]